ncbi:hypothetical protein ACA910_006609 [Epithemia clementina (nom. ined.)]
MFDPNTNGIRVTRNVIRLKCMYYSKPESSPKLVTDEVMFDVTCDGEVVALDEQDENEQDEPNQEQDPEQGQNEPDDNNNPTEILDNESEEDGEGEAAPNDTTTAATGSTTEAPSAATAPQAAGTTTSSGRRVNQPKWMEDNEMGMSAAEITYYKAMKEIANDLGVELGLIGAGLDWDEACLVGAGLGEGISNTNELKILSFDEAMQQLDRREWKKSVEDEHNRMKENAVFQPIPRDQVPHNSDIIDSTWSMKKCANGVYRARLAGRRFKQRPGVAYDPKSIFAPVVHKTTIKVALVLMVMAGGGGVATVVDVKGAFLKAPFNPRHHVYMEVPKGFEKFYPKNCVLLLLKTLYGVKNAAKAFWLVILKLMDYFGFKRNKADPCFYYQLTATFGLILFLSWINDIIFGSEEGVAHYKEKFTGRINCDDVGPLTDYVGNKIEVNKEDGWAQITQPVLLQSFCDEFTFAEPASKPKPPAVPGSVLREGDPGESFGPAEQKEYRSGVGKFLFLMVWSRPDILNAVRDLSRFMSGERPAHRKAMERCMQYCLDTETNGLFFKPTDRWTGDENF